MDIAQQAGLLIPHDLPGGTVRAMAEHGHVEIGYRDELTTRMPTPDEAQTLDLAVGVPVLAYVRTVVLPHNPSGALFQRPAKRVPIPRLHEVESLTG